MDEMHSEETLLKVRRALSRIVESPLVTDCINEMQNEGILFRERATPPLARDGKPGCPETVWDGPYVSRCSMGTGHTCAIHGRFA